MLRNVSENHYFNSGMYFSNFTGEQVKLFYGLSAKFKSVSLSVHSFLVFIVIIIKQPAFLKLWISFPTRDQTNNSKENTDKDVASPPHLEAGF